MNRDDYAVRIKNVTCRYSGFAALADVNLDIPKHSIYAFIGPSGCGKTTLLRSINRLNDFVRGFHIEGEIEIGGADIYKLSKGRDIEQARRRIGMIFQQPNPFPSTILKNMYMPVKEHYHADERALYAMAERMLKAAGLFDEVKDRLKKSAVALSGGQQQRLCIARALMLEPPLLLMDEPCSALDPIATMKIEDMLTELKKERSIIIVTHNMEQARRIADYTAFFYKGRVVEYGETLRLFSYPETQELDNYIRGRFMK